MDTPIFTRNFDFFEVWNGNLRLQIRIYDPNNVIFELFLEGAWETVTLETMFAEQYPEILDLFDFDNRCWNESELADFWDGLNVCLA